jgi:hypothetical protein
MKTVDSFFPTRTNYHTIDHHSQKLFHLIKKHNQSQQQTSPSEIYNIFQNAPQEISKNNTDITLLRPIGGLEIYKKIEKTRKENLLENRKHSRRSIKETTQRNIQTAQPQNRFKKDKTEEEQECKNTNTQPQ